MSLRARLMVGMAVIAVLLGVAAIAVTRATEDNLTKQIDDQLQRAAPAGRGALRERVARPDAEAPPDAPGSLYVAVLRSGGDRLITLATPSLTRDPTEPDLDVDDVRRHADQGPFTTGTVGSDLRYRVLVRSTPRLDAKAVYALPLEDVDATVQRLQAVQAVASLSILAVLALVTFWVLRLGVRPLKSMTETAAAIGEGDLSRRVPETTGGTEADDLGSALNKMLGRIESAFADRTAAETRLRRFVADASHELRTPVTTIRGYAELHRQGGLAEPALLDDAMRRVEAESERMGALVEDLLALTRLDERRPLSVEDVDLTSVVADAGRDAAAVEPSRPITVEAPSPVVVRGDDALIRQVVANLMANVRVHTSSLTPVRITVRADGPDAVVEVADLGPGMTVGDADRAFERFYRADPARSRHTGGSGLGLSIVATAMAAHGGTADLHTGPGQGTTVRLCFPVAGPPAADPVASGPP